MQELCLQCRGRRFCGKTCKILEQIKQYQPKVSLDFSGSSPPEIFVGHYNYPNVFSGILAPAEFGSTEELSMPEEWHKNNRSILEILNFRSRMIYSRFVSNTKKTDHLKEKMQEVALASKPLDASFHLKKKPQIKIELDKHVAMIGNPAPLKQVSIDSNIRVEKKVDYLVNDTDVKSAQSIFELYDHGIQVSQVIKLLTAGLLGLRFQRKLVPTRWAVTATDTLVSKELLKKVRYYNQLQEYRLFHANYLGNYFEILLMPSCWSFEVIECSLPGYFSSKEIGTWQDYEFFKERKTYASSVIGAYYADRLAVSEYLDKIKKQASCLIFREVRPEYWAPCGVGILRETVREALSKKYESFQNIEDAFNSMKTRLKLDINVFRDKSKLLKEIKQQKRLTEF